MMIKDHPCRKDCPDRSPICQATCVRLKEYREKRRADRKKGEDKFLVDCYQIDAINKHKRRNK
jgi:hypothetical protein